jgi:sugar phosphate isomerase/epimerase
MGLGTIDFNSYFEALKRVGFSRLYGSEVLFKDYSELLVTSNKIDEFNGKN